MLAGSTCTSPRTVWRTSATGSRSMSRAAAWRPQTSGSCAVLAAAQYGLRTLKAATSRENAASQKVLARAGFIPAGPADLAEGDLDVVRHRTGRILRNNRKLLDHRSSASTARQDRDSAPARSFHGRAQSRLTQVGHRPIE